MKNKGSVNDENTERYTNRCNQEKRAFQSQEESVIVVVRNEETYDIVGIIPIIRNIEEMKNETYQL